MNPEDPNGGEPTVPPTGQPAPDARLPSVEPVTGGLVFRWFAVPAVIVAAIIGCAVLVVVLFGAISTEAQLSIDQLLTRLESSTGERSLGGTLMPRPKESWQAALELSLRLNHKEKELTPDQIAQVAARLKKLIDAQFSDTEALSEDGRRRLHLLLRALGATEQPVVIETIARFVDDDRAETRSEALMAIGSLTHTPGARSVLKKVVAAVDDADPVVRTVACALLAGLATTADEAAIASLTRASASDQREVRWNASLTLARLGSPAGKLVLLDMLDRNYWQNVVKISMTHPDGKVSEYPLSPGKVDAYLMQSIEAAANLEDAEIRERIQRLSEDDSPIVSDKARAVPAHRD